MVERLAAVCNGDYLVSALLSDAGSSPASRHTKEEVSRGAMGKHSQRDHGIEPRGAENCELVYKATARA